MTWFVWIKNRKKYSLTCFVLNFLGPPFIKLNNCRQITENADIHIFPNFDFTVTTLNYTTSWNLFFIADNYNRIVMQFCA